MGELGYTTVFRTKKGTFYRGSFSKPISLFQGVIGGKITWHCALKKFHRCLQFRLNPYTVQCIHRESSTTELYTLTLIPPHYAFSFVFKPVLSRIFPLSTSPNFRLPQFFEGRLFFYLCLGLSLSVWIKTNSQLSNRVFQETMQNMN